MTNREANECKIKVDHSACMASINLGVQLSTFTISFVQELGFKINKLNMCYAEIRAHINRVKHPLWNNQ